MDINNASQNPLPNYSSKSCPKMRVGAPNVNYYANSLILTSLSANSDSIKRVALMQYNCWGYYRPQESLEGRELRLRNGLLSGDIFGIITLEKDGIVVGSSMLVKSDMDNRQQYYPWIAGVIVREQDRGKGVGTRLLMEIETLAKDRGFKEIFLHTAHANGFYSKIGWVDIENINYKGDSVTIMKKSL